MARIVDISLIDKNLKGAEITETDVIYYNIKDDPF